MYIMGHILHFKNVKHNMKNKQKLSKNWIVLKTETVKAKFDRTSMSMVQWKSSMYFQGWVSTGRKRWKTPKQYPYTFIFLMFGPGLTHFISQNFVFKKVEILWSEVNFRIEYIFCLDYLYHNSILIL